MNLLEEGAAKLGIGLGPRQVTQFRLYSQELERWNQQVNLTSITDPAEVQRVHFLDSLTVALGIAEAVRAGGRVCDVGAGAGFPGVPLKIAFPGISLTLIDSVAKRTAFLKALLPALGLDGVEVLTGRAEDLGHQPGLRDSFDLVVSRAVAALRVLLELTLPFCRRGGVAVLQKKGDIKEELSQASRALRELGGRLVEVRPVPTEVLGGDRVLVVVEKTGPTPARYPRRAGMPAKRPL